MSKRGPEFPAFECRLESDFYSPEVTPRECLLNNPQVASEAARKALIGCVSCDSCGQQYDSSSSLPVLVQVNCPQKFRNNDN